MHWKILITSFALVTSALAQTTPAPATTGSKRPFTFEDMMKLKRVGAPVPSPDGKWVVFDAVDVDLDANKKISHLWIVPATGGEARRLNQTPNHEERPRFSPDGKRLVWTSKATDPTQIWMSNFTPESGGLDGQPHQVTNISTGADGAIWSPDGKNIVFVSSVYPDAKDDAENKRRDEELGKSKVKAKIFTKLLYRHWTSYTEFKRSHLFVVSAEADAAQPNAARDLTPGDHDVPPFNLGGQDMYAISPDGQELAYTSNIDEVEATSTNNEIFIVPMAGGTPKKISTSPGNDNTPLYSLDGKDIIWRSMARSGFEADKESLVAYNRASGKFENLTKNFDRSVGSFTFWGGAILFTAEDHGSSPLYLLLAATPEGPTIRPASDDVPGLHADDLVWNKGVLFLTRMSISGPTEIWKNGFFSEGDTFATQAARGFEQLTHMNDALLSQFDMPAMEPFTFKGANNDDVQGFIVKPPGFDPAKKYPLKFLIHGGPQGAWGNSWSYRWNAELFAAGGYVVVMINFHGSTGYGQKFTDSISGDWGGKPYEDLMKGLDYVEKTYPFIDKSREAAMGASYGGYMANWLLGHTDRFKCIVSHDGVFNTESAYGTTEELWFTEWEFKGPPWKNRELYRKWSPHLFAEKFKTPTLVVHGQLDFRLDVSEGFQLFTTLQRLKVPSKMLYFPDEGHWVLKPQNSRLWYKTVGDWVDQWCAAK
ncbi:MAG TPA: S9 family peptidase [Chthoniobacterales bacterium]|nr:S9 family peptidase [Chthoniobacterales bacterium]